MKRELQRRSFMQGLLAASATAFALGCGGGGTTGTGGTGGTGTKPTTRVARKSASALSAEEIDRFTRAFGYAVEKGLFDIFNDEHFNHMRNMNHGAEVMATSPMTAELMPETWGLRLLPWHRSFLVEGEKMLRAALRKRNQEEGRDPAEGDLLFIPYWDAAHDQGLPQWVLDFQPKGGTAIVPPDLPPGHAGHGKPEGSRYDISFGRWPGKNLVFDTLATPDHIGRILAETTFADFYDGIDVTPEIQVQNYAKAQAALQLLKTKLPNDTSVQTLIDAFSQPPGSSGGSSAETINALFEIGWQAAKEAQKAMPDMMLIGAVKDVYSLFDFVPHLRMHLWAGGLDPQNADIRGSVTYFNELCVDPVFWMLHCELDRYWYTWEKSNADKPALSGDDAVFNPLTAEEGSWYGGGATYSLDELTRHEELSYTYDALFSV